MASNRKQQQPSNPNTAYMIMIAGAIAVVALVGWALSRSFNAPVASPSIAAPAGTPAPVTSSTTAASNNDEEAAKLAIPRISPSDLHDGVEKNEVTVIDVRPKEAFDSGHLKTAMNIPLASTEAYLSYIPRGKPIVTYCT
jgi:Rhodanese-like domain